MITDFINELEVANEANLMYKKELKEFGTKEDYLKFKKLHKLCRDSVKLMLKLPRNEQYAELVKIITIDRFSSMYNNKHNKSVIVEVCENAKLDEKYGKDKITSLIKLLQNTLKNTIKEHNLNGLVNIQTEVVKIGEYTKDANDDTIYHQIFLVFSPAAQKIIEGAATEAFIRKINNLSDEQLLEATESVTVDRDELITEATESFVNTMDTLDIEAMIKLI